MQDADRHRFFTDVQVQKAANPAFPVQLAGTLFETADAYHVPQQIQFGLPGQRHGRHDGFSRADVSPSGRPNSRALSRRRMSLPLRV